MTPTVDGPGLPKVYGVIAMTIPLSRATDAQIHLLQANGYRITGIFRHGVPLLIATKTNSATH